MATTYDKASLVMIPSGYKDDKLYSIKPTDGSGDFTFSRDGAGASPATRVNASGLIEKGRENILLQSNTFNTTWTQSDIATLTSGQSGYDGTSDAWLVEKSASANGYLRQNISSSGVHTFSLYAKSDTLDGVLIQTRGVSTKSAQFDLSTGILGTTANNIDAKIEDIGGGWYRCSVSVNDSAITQVRVFICDDGNTIGTTAGSIYIQDAQLEQGLVATDYIETTTAAVSAGLLGDMPRLDYSGGATCGSLLLEPSRVNSFVNSEYIAAGVTWSAASGITTENNSITSPEGVQNATKLIRPANSNAAWIRESGTSVTIGQNQVFSVFAKEGNEAVLNLTYYDVTDGDRFFNFNLSTQTISGNGLAHATYVNSDIEDYGNGWYRCYIVIDAGNTSPQLQIGVGANRAAAPNEYLYIYGAQHEQNASYPTSYIPTYGSASTRGADVCSKTSATALIGQTEGTILCEINTSTKTLSSSWAFSVNDGTTSNYIGLRRSGGNEFFAHINVAGSTTALIGTGITSGVHKIAIAYANNDIQVYVDGASVGTDTSSAIPATSVIELGDLISNRYLDDSIKQFVTFPTRLTNAELAALTA